MIEAPKSDLPMLRKVWELIKAEHAKGDDSTWDQNQWRAPIYQMKTNEFGSVRAFRQCGTSFCFAGWTVELHPELKWLDPRPEGQVGVVCGDQIMGPDEAVRTVLGLTRTEGNQIFYSSGDNPDEDLVEIRKVLEGVFERNGEKFEG